MRARLPIDEDILTRGVRRRFWSKVNFLHPGGCWTWTAASFCGYGRFRIGPRSGGRAYQAHRLAYAMFHGGLGPDLYVCHVCDNPSCVNPAHLFLGTQRDNMDDAARKGRTVKGIPRSELPRVLAARRQGETLVEIADRFGSTQSTIGKICAGQIRRRCVEATTN